MGCSEKKWDFEVKHVKTHRTKKEKKATTAEEHFVIEGNEKADELAKGWSGRRWRCDAAAKALTIKQLRKDILASI